MRNPFIRALVTLATNPLNNSFNYNDLMVMFPSSDFFKGMPNVTDMSARGQDSAPLWDITSLNTATAMRLYQLMAGLMREHGFYSLICSTTNAVVDDVAIVSFSDAKGFMTTNPEEALKRLQSRLEHEIKHYLTRGNIIGLAVDMQMDMAGESWIAISVNNGPTTGYVIPSFCDALFTPVLLSNRHEQVAIAADFAMIVHDALN
jgi:hypothetical protein